VAWTQALNDGLVCVGIGHLTTIPESQMMGQMIGAFGADDVAGLPARTTSRKLRFLMIANILRDVVYEDGGPLVHNGSEEEQRSFDSTCRKLHRFLTQSQL
jgi:hypothetical protein